MRELRHKSLIESVHKTTSLPCPSDRDIEKTKRVLGQVASHLTDEELKTVTSEIRFLVESWLDDFERNVFEGKTLRELLCERTRL